MSYPSVPRNGTPTAEPPQDGTPVQRKGGVYIGTSRDLSSVALGTPTWTEVRAILFSEFAPRVYSDDSAISYCIAKLSVLTVIVHPYFYCYGQYPYFATCH